MKRIAVLLVVCSIAISVSYAENLYDQYTHANTDSIILESGIKVAFCVTPDTALNQIHDSNLDYDLYVFPLPQSGLNTLLDSKQLLDLSSIHQLNVFYQSIPITLQSALTRNDQFLAFPLHFEMHPSYLYTTTEKLNAYDLSLDSLPHTVLELLEVGNTWYQSGKLDGVNLIHHYEGPEMIVYWAMQQYTIANTTHGASPDYFSPLFKRILEQALLLSDAMTQHGAFSANTESLFNSSSSGSPAENPTSSVILSLTLSDYHPSSDYLVGLVAIPNPHSTKREAVLSYLASEVDRLSASTLELLDATSFSRTLSVLSEEMDRLATNDYLYTIAKQLVDQDISIEYCINVLQN